MARHDLKDFICLKIENYYPLTFENFGKNMVLSTPIQKTMRVIFDFTESIPKPYQGCRN